jgi:hypothetical protein
MRGNYVQRAAAAVGAILFALAAAPSAKGATWFVNPDGSGNFLTIQEAINASANGDVIIVAAGTYVEELLIPVSVTIAGAGVGQTIVWPATSIPGVGNGSQLGTTTWLARVRAHDVTITGMSFEGDNPNIGGAIDARGGVVTDFTAGSFNGLVVANCQVSDVVYRGLYAAAGGSGHRFLSNRVTNVQQVFLDSVGIFFFGAVGEARDNDVEDCSIGIGFQSGGGGMIADNRIAGCDLGVLANGSSSPVTIAQNDIDASEQGVQGIAVNTAVTVQENTTTGCTTGLTLFGLGSGSFVADGNTFDAQSLPGSSGIFASTDVSPFGFGDLHLLAKKNVLRNNETAIALFEDGVNNYPVLDCTLSGAASDYNTFTGSTIFNVELIDCDDDVPAQHNFWGAVNPALIAMTLWHEPNDPSLGLIDFSNTVNLLITVDDDGPADFPTINPAVQALLPGGTIVVKPGLYQEDVLVDRSCLIQGSGTSPDPATGTILRGASIHPDMTVVTVTGPDVFVQNLRVDGQQPVYLKARRAIYATGTSGLTVTDCVLHTATTGIGYVSSTGGTFLRNEVYDFGKSLQEGGGIFLLGSSGAIGAAGNGNYAHDGLATGFLHHNGSSGTCVGNLAQNCPLGHLSNGSQVSILIEENEALDCDQGYQSIANNVAVLYRENRATFCQYGFTLFGLGAALHTYEGNYVQGDLVLTTSSGFWWTTDSVFGDSDLNAVARSNSVTGCGVGVVLDETPSSVGYALNADLAGSAGTNLFAGNQTYDIELAGCNDDIDASDNYFGSLDPVVVETRIFHQPDQASLGLVSFGNLQPVMTYCKPKVHSGGCGPRVAFNGAPSASLPTPFDITASEVLNQKNGLLAYAYAQDVLPFQGGLLCIKAPIRRTPVQSSGGNAGPPDCSGSFTFDMQQHIQSGIDPGLIPGATVFAQYWFRDPPAASGSGLSDAVQFVIDN